MHFSPMRTVHSIGRHLQKAWHTGLNVARSVDEGIRAARPTWERLKPLLHEFGIGKYTAHADNALDRYDTIRRAVEAAAAR